MCFKLDAQVPVCEVQVIGSFVFVWISICTIGLLYVFILEFMHVFVVCM